MSKRTSILLAVVALCLAGLLCASPAAQAIDYYWDIGNTNLPPGPSLGDGIITGGTGTWGTGNTNWTTDGGAYNVIWGNNASSTAVFTDVGGLVKMNDLIAGGITFDNPSATGYTLQGVGGDGTNTLSLGGGGVIQTLATDGAHVNTFTTKLKLTGATATFSSNSANSTMEIGYNISGWMTVSSGLTTTLTLNGTNTGKNVLGWATTGSNTLLKDDGGLMYIVKDGPGTWWLSGKLNFRGGLTIKEGTLVYSHKDSSLGTAGITLGNSAVDVNDATLVSGDSGRSVDKLITLAAGTTGILTIAGGTDLATTTYVGGVTGSNDLTLDSRGTLLTMGGTVGINNAGALTVKGAGNTDITAVIGSNVMSLTKTGTGTLTLSGANAYPGETFVSGGRLQLNGSAAVGTLSTSGLTVGAGATLGFTAGSMSTLDLTGRLFTLGGGTVEFDIGATTYDALTVGDFTLSDDSYFTINAIPTLTLGTPYTLLTSTGVITNTGGFSITVPGGGGKLVYATTIGTNDVKFTASMSEGEWNQASGGNWSDGNPNGPTGGNWKNYKPTVAGDAALFGALITAPATIAVDTPHTVGYMRFDNATNAYTIGAAGSSNLTLDNGASAAAITVTSGSHIIAENILLNSDLTVLPASGATLTVSGDLSGTGGVEKKDAGELVLSGANAYIGATKVSAGTLSLNGSHTGVGAFTVSAGTLSVNGSLTGGGAIAVNGSAVLLEGATGAISGAASITHSSTGASILSGANTYTGDTTVNAGLLKLDNANALPGGVGVTGGTSRLVFNGGVVGLTSDFNRLIGAGVDQVLFNGGGGGFAAFGADRIVDFGLVGNGTPWVKWGTSSDRIQGTLYLSHSTATHTVTVANSFDLMGATRTVSVANGAADVDAVLSGYLHNGSLTKTGSGTLVLTGAYTAYTTNSMNTRVEGGTLSIGGAGWLAYTNNSGTVFIAAGATLNHNSSSNQTLSGIISGGGVITKTGGAGLLILSNANTYTGKTTVSAGTLSFNSIQDAGSATASALGQPAVGADSIIDLGNTGRLKYTGAGHSSNRVINLAALTGGAMTLDAGGAGTFALTGGVTSAGTSGTSTLTLTGAGLGSESAAIADGTSPNVTAVTKSGTGTWTLSGANTYTGATTVSAGTLDLGGGTANGSLASTVLNLGGGLFAYTRNDSATQGFTTTNLSGLPAISVALGNTLNLGTIVHGAGGFIDFSSTGAGTVAADTASNLNGIIPGATFGDTWAVANGAGVAISGLAAYTLTSDALNDADNYTAANIDANSSQTPDAAITPYSLRFNTAGAYTLTLQGTNVITTGGILVGSTVGANLCTITGGTLAGAASDSLVVVQNNTSAGLTIASDIVDNTGATGLTKSGAGLLTLTGANTYTGVTALRGGTLSVSSLANAGLPSNIGQYASAGAAGLLLGGTLQYTGVSTVVDRGFTLNASSTVDVNSTGTGTALGLGACSLGAFTLNVTGGAGSSLGLGAVTLTGAATLNPTTASLTVASVAGAFNLTLDGTAVGNSVTGVIGTGARTLTKSNTGDWTLSGANTYTGDTTVSGGTLTLGPGGRLNAGNYAGAISIASGAFLTYANPSAAQTLSGAITGAGTLSQSSGNDLILSGAGNSFSNLTISGGRVFINTNAGALPSGATTTISNQGILDFGVGATYSGTITVQNGGGIATRVAAGTTLSNVTLPGSGTVVFNNDDARTYLLTISSSQAISTGGTLTVQVGGGRVGANPIGAVTLSGDISGSGSLAKTGDGTLNLSGVNAYTGATTVRAGVLTISQPYLDDASTVTISIMGGLNLAFTDSSVIDLVGDLWLGDTHASPGVTYNSGNTGYITGTGNIKIASLPGDTNGDFVVDAADFMTLKKNFGTPSGAGAGQGNFDGDGDVDWNDLNTLTNNMGTGGGAPATTPEPCSAMLLMFGAAALLRRRRA